MFFTWTLTSIDLTVGTSWTILVALTRLAHRSIVIAQGTAASEQEIMFSQAVYMNIRIIPFKDWTSLINQHVLIAWMFIVFNHKFRNYIHVGWKDDELIINNKLLNSQIQISL